MTSITDYAGGRFYIDAQYGRIRGLEGLVSGGSGDYADQDQGNGRDAAALS